MPLNLGIVSHIEIVDEAIRYHIFLSDCNIFFDVSSCISKLKCFDYSESSVTISFTKLRQNWDKIWRAGSKKQWITIKLSFWTKWLLLSLLVFDFVPVVSHYIAIYDPHTFILYLNVVILTYVSEKCFFCRQMKNFL